MNNAKPSESKFSLVLRTFCAMPMFLILTVIFWELILGAWLLSDWLYERGWSALGFSAKIVAILLAALTVFLTLRVFVWWVVHLVRVIRGRET